MKCPLACPRLMIALKTFGRETQYRGSSEVMSVP